MSHKCEVLKETEIQGACGLFGKEDIARSNSEGLLLALREMVEHFQITWGVTPLHESDSGDRVEIGFVLELNGTHEPVADHSERSCRHCANLLLALRIVGDWLFPRQGKCAFCEVQVYHNFVCGDEEVQGRTCSMRALRLISQPETHCRFGSCHVWCMTKLTERLNRIGAAKRGSSRPTAEGVGA